MRTVDKAARHVKARGQTGDARGPAASGPILSVRMRYAASGSSCAVRRPSMSGIRLAVAAALTVALAVPVVFDAPAPRPEPTHVRPGSARSARAAALVEPAAPVRLTGLESAPDTVLPAPVGVETVEVAEPRPDETEATRSLGSGMASYYGAELAGNATASGERFDPSDLTAAHRTLPFGTRVEVTNPRTGATVVVRINDRGPFHGGRVIDLSHEAARRVGIARAGTGRVELAVVVE